MEILQIILTIVGVLVGILILACLLGCVLAIGTILVTFTLRCLKELRAKKKYSELDDILSENFESPDDHAPLQD